MLFYFMHFKIFFLRRDPLASQGAQELGHRKGEEQLVSTVIIHFHSLGDQGIESLSHTPKELE